MVRAVQLIYTPHGTQEVVLPADPSLWLKPRYATAVQIVGESPSEEFIMLAEAFGWKFFPDTGKFYPTEEA